MNLRFQKEKKLRRKDAFTTTAMRVYFASLAHKQIILQSADFAGDKDMTFDFSDACLLGHPSYFIYQGYSSLVVVITLYGVRQRNRKVPGKRGRVC